MLVSRCAWNLYNFRRGVIRALLEDQCEVVAVAAERSDYGSRLLEMGSRYVPIDIPGRAMNPLQDLLLLWRLYRLYRKERPDVVHHHTIKPVIYGSIAAKLAGVPRIVNTVTGLGYVFTGQAHPLLTLLVEGMYRFSLRFSEKTLFMNPADRSLFIERKIVCPLKADLITGGVDLERFQPCDPISGIQRGSVRFLMVARLLRDKGVYEFVEAARTVRRTRKGARFTLVGPRDAFNPTVVPEEVLREWVEEGIVEWIGEVDDIRGPLRDADVMVLPSYREGTSKALLEAGAMGKPIITTDVPGCREVVLHAVNGLLVPPKDAAALADAMQRLIDNPDLRIRLGMDGRTRIENEFDERRMVEKIIGLYELDQIAA